MLTGKLVWILGELKVKCTYTDLNLRYTLGAETSFSQQQLSISQLKRDIMHYEPDTSYVWTLPLSPLRITNFPIVT